MKRPAPTELDELTLKLTRETSTIAWSELQRFFASGHAVYVDASLDLIAVAKQFSNDDKAGIEQHMKTNAVGLVSDETAAQWLEQDMNVWAVVVRPWVLVQAHSDNETQDRL